MVKEDIRSFAIELGVDHVGFASVADYRSPKSPPRAAILPDAKAIIVLALKELERGDSADLGAAMNGRLDLMAHSRSCNDRLSRFLERSHRARTAAVPASYPMEMSRETKGTIRPVSMRHVAVAAGLGAFGRDGGTAGRF